jgi:non-lysosomal glucosylceramidase
MPFKTYFILVLAVLFATLVWGTEPHDKKVLYDFSPVQKFIANHLREIAFPIGGIGTGNITIGGRGDLRDWEIFNRPGKGKQPNLTFFAIWARPVGNSPVAKILERKLLPPYTGWMGIPRQTLAGVERFDEVEFHGEYPLAWLNFRDGQIPVDVKLEAYNPMIPLDPDNSGIPVAIFNWIISNLQDDRVEVAICFSMQNPIGTDGKDFGRDLVKNGVNEFVDMDNFSALKN